MGSGTEHLNILITTSYYWPEQAGSAPYLSGLAEHLQHQGHRVVVATGYPHYPEWRLPPGSRLACTEWHGQIEVRRRWHYVPRSQTTMRRAVYEATLFGLGLSALSVDPRPDLVVGTCPSLAAGALAAAASRLHGAPYALIVQDLMGKAAQQSGLRGGGRVASPVQKAELAVARGAAAVGIIADGFRAYLEAGGVCPDRIRRLRNWTRRTEPVETVEETRRRLGWRPGDFICLHGGNLGRKQGLDNLLDAALQLRSDSVRLVLAGDGNDRARLEARARELSLLNVQFVELQRPGYWEAAMAAADVLLVNQRASVTDMSLPSKLTSYFAAGRPVLAAASADSETAREIDAAGAGIVVPPDDPAALCHAIVALQRGSQGPTMGENGRRYAERLLSPQAALAEYDSFLNEVVAGPRPGPLTRLPQRT